MGLIVFPKMMEVKQKIRSPKLETYVSAIKDELKKKDLSKKIQLGSKIAITAGSRGIAHYSKILVTIVQEVKQVWGNPFLLQLWEAMVVQLQKGNCRF